MHAIRVDGTWKGQKDPSQANYQGAKGGQEGLEPTLPLSAQGYTSLAVCQFRVVLHPKDGM